MTSYGWFPHLLPIGVLIGEEKLIACPHQTTPFLERKLGFLKNKGNVFSPYSVEIRLLKRMITR